MIESVSGSMSASQLQAMRATGAARPAPSAEQLEQTLKQGIESGEIDTAELQARLTERFGDEASGIVSENGSVDYDKLVSLLEANQPSGEAGGPGGAPPMGGPPPGPPPSSEEMVSSIEESLESGEMTIEELQEQLISDFGDEAEGIIGEDGSVDYEKLTELLESHRPEQPIAFAGGTTAATSNGYNQPPSLDISVFIDRLV